VVCRPSTRRALVTLLALTFLCAAPPLARAACPAQPLDRTFLPWLDAAWYEAAPDGGLEAGGAGWALAGGAAVTDGNNPYQDGASSLSLPTGASATTPSMCVDVAHPTVRFFGRGGTSPLLVSVRFTDPLGLAHELPVGAMLGSGSWTPSPVLAVVGNLLSSQVRFRLTALGPWQVDDVFVDPYSKG
jgi:hypothetical protein